MQKFYWAILWEVSLWYPVSSDELHDMFKVWYKKQTTSWMSYDDRREYLENILYFIMCVFDQYYDSDGYKYDRISFVWMFWSERPQRITNYEKPKNLFLLY